MRFPLLTLAAGLALSATLATADDAADAKAIVAKALKAASWPDDGKVPNMTWKDKGTIQFGGMKVDYTSEWWVSLPDKERFEMKAEVMGQKIAITAVVNGDKAWESGFGKTVEITGEKLESTRNEVYLMWVSSLIPLTHDKGFKLATAGEKDVAGRKAAGVKVTRDKRPDVTLYFDKATGLLAKTETKVKDEFQGWKEVPEETYYEDWKDVNGKKQFHKIRSVRDGKPLIESTLSDQKEPATLDPKLFDKP